MVVRAWPGSCLAWFLNWLPMLGLGAYAWAGCSGFRGQVGSRSQLRAHMAPGTSKLDFWPIVVDLGSSLGRLWVDLGSILVGFWSILAAIAMAGLGCPLHLSV